MCRCRGGRICRPSGAHAPIVLKRYGGSRFYDTVALRYVTVSDPREWADSIASGSRTCPLTRLASLRWRSARKSTSPRTRGEVAQVALRRSSSTALRPGRRCRLDRWARCPGAGDGRRDLRHSSRTPQGIVRWRLADDGAGAAIVGVERIDVVDENRDPRAGRALGILAEKDPHRVASNAGEGRGY